MKLQYLDKFASNLKNIKLTFFYNLKDFIFIRKEPIFNFSDSLFVRTFFTITLIAIPYSKVITLFAK
ncbi:hypothetical protein RhiirA1_424950 [Rhizophagus irregularis]|uniref:Uncharacterized protein n=1 Tax=Rhizophagus irregularis TaxID=588596 RepID=A0A2N0RDF1_9GLOM|nr:hypothetical protein RhiirA1_424950 [Rhizophagus irregularis]